MGIEGPFMILGLRVGLVALRRLGASGWFDICCRVELTWRPPDSCVIEEIQISTGCTMGKHNIEVSEKEEISTEFTKGSDHVRIVLSSEVHDRVRRTVAVGEDSSSLVEELATADLSDLFELH
jgi:formylmethanofuran dehydrogenase subunit E